MSEIEYLLQCMEEEAAEVIQAISKYRRFGADDSYTGVTPIEMLKKELNDFWAVTRMVEKAGVPIEYDQDMGTEKKLKVYEMMQYSRSLGKVEGERVVSIHVGVRHINRSSSFGCSVQTGEARISPND